MSGCRTENVQADQAYDRGHAVAIQRQVFKGGVACRLQDHFHALDEFLEVGLGNLQPLGMVRQTDHERPGRFAAVDTVKLGAPATKFFLGIASSRRLIDGAIHRFAESVNRIHRVTPALREEQKGIVEVAAAGLCEGRAICLSLRNGHRHEDSPVRHSFPVRSRTESEARLEDRFPAQMSASNSTPSTRRGPGRLKYEPASTTYVFDADESRREQ